MTMASYEVAEYMVAKLDGQCHPALLARPGSGIIFDGVRKCWVLEADGTDCGMYDASSFSTTDVIENSS